MRVKIREITSQGLDIVDQALPKDLDLDVRVRVMPTVREKDGLAMSSRNRYLSGADKSRAETLSRALLDLRTGLKKTKASIAVLKTEAVRKLKRYVDKVQYLEVVDERTLEPITVRRKRMAALAACFVGKTRLIDNVTIHGK
jgi:pantoate--beta-alanine ligase